AAHQVARPAAPVTAYAVGYAEGLAAARGESSDALDRATSSALSWQDPGPVSPAAGAASGAGS
ncbi:DUF6457 domain-containing protein, partial [Isoptericola sp. QY 916]|uniref:DUF6457 domain-containing protein n=1 Tax=Isoptericola sp. QY 916 TaxID=2782570 RepID=UPI003D2FEFD1|nr:hypothetical protein [Isoptericola sp. QY 916]